MSWCPQSGSFCGSVSCSVGSAGRVILQAPLREPLWPQRSSVASDSCRWTTLGQSRCTPRCSSPTGRWTHHKVRVTVWRQHLYLWSVTCRSQRSSLWLLDSAGLISEQIPLNPSDFCPYSATGSTMVRWAHRQFVTMVTPTPGIFTFLSVHRGAWSTPTTAVQRILIG